MFRYFVSLSLLLSSLLLTPAVLAVDNTSAVARNTRRQSHLTEVKLKVCQNREAAIKKRAENLGKMASSMLKKFAAHAQRVEEFYTTKVVPSGQTVANYDSLVADIQTKNTAVQIALTQAQSNVSSFTCSGTDPKGQLTQYRSDMLAVKSALKDYRTAIKNLIVAVRS